MKILYSLEREICLRKYVKKRDDKSSGCDHQDEHGANPKPIPVRFEIGAHLID